MAEAFICAYVRTPIGRYAGALSSVRADDLGAVPIRELMQQNPGTDWAALDEVYYGNANQAGEDNRNGGSVTAGNASGVNDGAAARITGSAALELSLTSGRRALAAMCVGVGQGIAVALERV